MRACGLSRELKKLASCWTAIFWNASLANAVPSLAAFSLLELSHHHAPPSNPSTMISRTTTCPDDFLLVLNLNCFILVLITEPHALDYCAVTNEHRMFLLACVRAKTISCVHSEINQITGDSFAALGHIGWFWFSAPLNACAVWIDQLGIEPLHNDLLIIGGVRAVARGVW